MPAGGALRLLWRMTAATPSMNGYREPGRFSDRFRARASGLDRSVPLRSSSRMHQIARVVRIWAWLAPRVGDACACDRATIASRTPARPFLRPFGVQVQREPALPPPLP
jgi:hypothetical protein